MLIVTREMDFALSISDRVIFYGRRRRSGQRRPRPDFGRAWPTIRYSIAWNVSWR